jgi:PAT family beta-lactamase induction signal transducer AmpG
MSHPAPSAAPNDNTPPATVRTWREALRLYLQPASLRMLALGFSAGLPLLLVLGTLSFRLRASTEAPLVTSVGSAWLMA